MNHALAVTMRSATRASAQDKGQTAMKLDELRRHLRSNLESGAAPTTQAKPLAEDIADRFAEAERARICFDCSAPLDEDADVLCSACVSRRHFRSMGTKLAKCDGCGLTFKVEGDETTCAICSL